jgi:Site-specific recombinase XerD
MDVSLIPVASDVQIVLPGDITTGLVANQVADRTAHIRYTEGKASNTLRRQLGDLKVFVHYLLEVGYEYDMFPFLDALERKLPLTDQWYSWQGITYGHVEGFVRWQELRGYSIGSVNVRLSTVKAYAKLAQRAKAIDQMNLAAILMVKGPTHKEGVHIDKQRDVTRVGNKKAAPTVFSAAHAVLLKQSKRLKDRSIMCLLIDLGLRCSEIASLKVADVDLQVGTITFYREKVDLIQTHRLTPDCLVTLQQYLPTVSGIYLFPGHKGKQMSTNGINKRVGELGEAVGIDGLSPHDCRHSFLQRRRKKGQTSRRYRRWADGLAPLWP